MKEKKLNAKNVGAFIGRPHIEGNDIKEYQNKFTANAVGVAPLGDPHFKENTPASSKAYSNPNTKHQTLTSNVAITLIALVITIIVMLILVAVTVTVAIKGGLFTTAKQSTTDTQYHADREMLLSAVIGAINKDAEVDFEKLDANLPNGFTGTQGEYTSEAGNLFCVNKNGNIIKPVTVTDGTETVILTPKNVGEYLGSEVTNYKGQSSVNGYTVSTTYRLYYVDFDNKYGDGAGTVYLKADCTKNNYELKTDTTQSTEPNIKIKNLNPELYKNGNPPTSENMKAVTWLTNTNNWNGLKPIEYTDGIIGEDINYIVGAPSLEMMMDSYNTHYKLTGDEDFTTSELKSKKDARVKLFYKYPYDSKNYGYGVGPADSETYSDLSTSYYSVKTDEKIDSMYYPGNEHSYWLASPMAYSDSQVVKVICSFGGNVNCDDYEYRRKCFLPVSFFKIFSPIKVEIVVVSAEFKDKYSNRRS